MNKVGAVNQIFLCNIFNSQNDLRTPEQIAGVVSTKEEQNGNVLVFLKFNMEELARLLNGHGVQAVANVCSLLIYLPYMSTKRG